MINDQISNQKIKSSLYSPYYAEACNELRGPSPRLSAWATQLRRNVATVASRWRHCADLTGPGIEPQTSRCVAQALSRGDGQKHDELQSESRCHPAAHSLSRSSSIQQLIRSQDHHPRRHQTFTHSLSRSSKRALNPCLALWSNKAFTKFLA